MGIVWNRVRLNMEIPSGRLLQQHKVGLEELPVEVQRQRRVQEHPEEKWPRRRVARACKWPADGSIGDEQILQAG